MSTDLENPTSADVEVDEAHDTDDDTDDDIVEVRRDGPLSGVVGGVGSAVAVAYLLRAVSSTSPLDWVLCLAIGVVGVLHLCAFVDSRAPLMVLDHHGVRVRRGRVWQGMSWPEVERVEHRPRRSLLRDGSLTVVHVDGSALGVRLSLSTRLIGSDWHELGEALSDLSEGRTSVVEVVDPVVDVVDVVEVSVPDEQPAVPAAVAPARSLARGRRSEVVLDKPPTTDRPDAGPTPGPTDPTDADETSVLLSPVGALAEVDPVVGPQLVAARTRLGLGVDQLAERTRIRPHVIESIEVDDFGPCGGDFYARGHLRTLARILGVDAEPLLETYDERYADAPIDPRRVFEAELATGAGGSIRGTRGRLNWSVLIAAVMAAVLVWSVARLVMDGSAPVSDRVVLNGSPGQRAQLSGATTAPVPVRFTAATGGARVIVRDGRQRVVFDEELAFMQTATLDVVPPVLVKSSDGGLLVSVDGDDEAALGGSGREASQVFVP